MSITRQDREIRLATILFADVRNSSEISNVLSLEDYDEFISEYQVLMREAIDEALNAHFAPGERRYIESSVRGDEAFVITYVGTEEECVDRNIRVALQIAFDMKRKWMLSAFNRRRILQGKMVEDIGIGINLGEVVVGVHPGRGQVRTAEGWAINLAKKIEGTTREGHYSKIMVSEGVYRRARRQDMGVFFAERRTERIGDIGRHVPIHEVKAFNLTEWNMPIALDRRSARLMRRAFANSPYDLWLGLQVGNDLYNAQQFHEALEIYRDAIELEPTFALGFYNTALCHYKLGAYGKALEHCREALRLDPDYDDAHYLCGLLHVPLGDPEEEIRAYERALALNPSHTGARINLAECQLLQGNYAEGIAVALAGTDLGLPVGDGLLCRFLALLGAALAGHPDWREQSTALGSALTSLPAKQKLQFDFTDCLDLVRSKLQGATRQEIVQLIRRLKRRA